MDRFKKYLFDFLIFIKKIRKNKKNDFCIEKKCIFAVL